MITDGSKDQSTDSDDSKLTPHKDGVDIEEKDTDENKSYISSEDSVGE